METYVHKPKGVSMTIREPALRSLHPGVPRTFSEITIRPLRARPMGPSVTLFYPEVVDIREQDGEATVGCIHVENLTDRPLLLLAGELLEGARQNRLVNASTLIAPRTRHDLKVSCVEQGRWSEAAATFAYGGRAELALRNAMDNGQGATWDTIAAMNTERGGSATGSYIAANGAEMLAYRQTLRTAIGSQHQVVGAVIAQGQTIVHAEVFGDPNLAAVGRTTLLDGYARDAVVMNDLEAITPDPEAAALYLQRALSGGASLHIIDAD